MREIKFRGKRVDNGEWVYGCLINYLTNKKPRIIYFELIEGNGQHEPDYKETNYEVIPETVGQYIGKNKSGQEFFEGDITEQGVILYSEEKSIFCENFKNSFTKQLTISCYPMDIERAKLLANIHDNPEIL